MPTETIILVALAINLVVAAAVVIVPRVRNRRSPAAMIDASRATRSSAAEPMIGSPSRPSAHAAGDAGAGAPWFPAPVDGPAMRSATRSAPGPERGVPSTPAPAAFGTSVSGVAAIDPATGLDMEPAWYRWLSEEEARIRRFHRPATVVFVELTGLDRLADRLGDEAAGRLIPPIATTMRRQARATDHLARLGPTLFGAILTETDEIRAINYIERIRGACDVWLEAGAVMLRLSVGWAEVGPDRPAEVAVPDAERRLYEERQRTWAVLAREAEQRNGKPTILHAAQG
jgi:diguanylate cyclase (GGDEF)-like protein